jgi:lipopolysaccharide transport system ATP-binding protein
MTESMAIVVDGVTKTYVHRGHRPAALKEAVLRGFRGARSARRVTAVRDVSFTVERGRTVGIVGPNGAGKSTLLRLVGGVGRPDRGNIAVAGRVAALLELAAPFHPDLTGREVAVLGGVIAGLTRREVLARVGDIAEFGGIVPFIDDPVRTYSTGMQARLGFSIAAHTDPDVLLVDEVLAVGDAAFQRRCVDRIRRFQRDGVTILVVSHDHRLVAEICDEVVWLRGGSVVAAGAPDTVVAAYLDAVADVAAATPATAPTVTTPPGVTLRAGENRFGTFGGRIVAVRLLDAFGRDVRTISARDQLTVDVEVDAPADGGEPMLGVTLVRHDGLLVVDSSTNVAAVDGRGRARLVLERLDLAPGAYSVSVGLHAPGWGTVWDHHDRAYPLRVAGEPTEAALVPPLTWEQESAISATKWVRGWGA